MRTKGLPTLAEVIQEPGRIKSYTKVRVAATHHPQRSRREKPRHAKLARGTSDVVYEWSGPCLQKLAGIGTEPGPSEQIVAID